MFQSTYPWDDHGDEVVLDKVIAPNVIVQPFEVFFREALYRLWLHVCGFKRKRRQRGRGTLWT